MGFTEALARAPITESGLGPARVRLMILVGGPQRGAAWDGFAPIKNPSVRIGEVTNLV